MCAIPISLFAFSHRHFHLHPPHPPPFPLPSLPLIWQPVGLLPALNTTFPGYSSSVISTLSPYWNYEWKALLFFTNNSGFLSQSNSNGSDCQTKRLYDGQSSQQVIKAYRKFLKAQYRWGAAWAFLLRVRFGERGWQGAAGPRPPRRSAPGAESPPSPRSSPWRHLHLRRAATGPGPGPAPPRPGAECRGGRGPRAAQPPAAGAHCPRPPFHNGGKGNWQPHCPPRPPAALKHSGAPVTRCQ